VSKAVYESHSVVGDKGLSQLKGIAPAPKKTAVNSAAYYDPRDQTIYVKNYASGGVGRLTASAKKLADAGWFTTDSPMHIIRHEIGHSVHMVLSPDVYLAKYTGTNEFDIAVSKLKEDVKMLPTKVHRARRREESLSEYGMTNNAEYVAEAYAEYLNGNPRKPAADVMKLIFDRLGAI
jgi:hypothetical protein